MVKFILQQTRMAWSFCVPQRGQNFFHSCRSGCFRRFFVVNTSADIYALAGVRKGIASVGPAMASVGPAVAKPRRRSVQHGLTVAGQTLSAQETASIPELAVDAIGARFDLDKETAQRRMEGSGATLTTTEAALFEWCERSDTVEFKTISALVREPMPDSSVD